MRRTAILLLALGLAACAENPTEGELFGTGAGAVVGGGIGRAAATGTHFATTFTPVGVVAGATAGYVLGGWFDPHPNRLWSAATVEAAETGKEVRWGERGLEGAVTPKGEGWSDNGGRACRRLVQAAWHEGKADEAYSREVQACRLADGTWEVVTPPEDEPKS
jgi:surface antigen